MVHYVLRYFLTWDFFYHLTLIQKALSLFVTDGSEITSTELEKWKLLLSAIKTGHVTTIERILSQGFDIDSKYSPDGETLLMIAARIDNLVRLSVTFSIGELIQIRMIGLTEIRFT